MKRPPSYRPEFDKVEAIADALIESGRDGVHCKIPFKWPPLRKLRNRGDQAALDGGRADIPSQLWQGKST